MDVFKFFLQGDLFDEVYMTLPKDFYSQGKNKNNNIVCKLVKSLNGLKQAFRQWNAKLIEALCTSGYTQSHLDYSPFTKNKGSSLVVVLIYVDHLLIIRNDAALIVETK